MTRWAMVADLERCVGCQTCTAACRHANATQPEVQWRRVLDIEAGTFPDVSRTFVPVGCQHCEDPPCMHVCPTTATRQRADGIVTVDYDLCIGCAYCDVACPYQARFKVDRDRYAYGSASPLEHATHDASRLGVSQKCTFCSDRVDAGLAQGLRPGVDPAATPACVNACIADALHFGDMDDPNSNVATLVRSHPSFRMHEALGTRPRFHYLQDRRQPSAPQPARGEGIEPAHQQHWDWKAAMNFILGGAGASLAAMASVWSFATGVALGMALAALGLAILLFKIGRPLRALYVLRQPRRSWMSREAWIAGAFFLAGAWFLYSGSGGIAVAVLGALFLLSQAMILREAKGIPAWRVNAIVPLIVATGACEGAGLLALFFDVQAVLAALLFARATAWIAYARRVAMAGAPARALEVLDRCKPWMLWGATLLPLVLLVAGWTVLAGLVAVAAGWMLKFVIVTRAGWQQGFALERGATTIRPGWN